ncbi:MAG: hypothetical protein VKI81_06865, partial [Synechococcaceae cyanobacterium]|nr:hypothetical protein [Synechococcaceae cyanobacterium]
ALRDVGVVLDWFEELAELVPRSGLPLESVNPHPRRPLSACLWRPLSPGCTFPIMTARTRASRLWTLPTLALLGVACVSVPTQTPNMQPAGAREISAAQLREMVLQFAEEYAEGAELLADSMRAASDDPVLSYRALLWKATSVHQMRQAALLSDPLLGLIDAWLYTIQLQQFIASPPPVYDPVDGAHRPVAIDFLDRMQRRARGLAVSLVGEESVAEFEPRLVEYASERPINPLNLGRTSIMAADSTMLRPVGGGLGGTMAATYWSMRDVADRVSALDATLGKELRWNVELLAYDLAGLPVVDSTLTSVRASLDRIAALADTLPSFVSGERTAVLDALHTELAGLTAAIESMRVATLATVSEERAAVIDALARERIAMLEALTVQRIATLAAVDSILAGTIDRSERLVDHVIWRLAQLFAIGFVLLVIAVAILLRVWRPSRS